MADGPDKLQVVADFDRTLSKYTHRGQICATCHNVLEEGGILPDFYKEKALKLREKYFSIETDPEMTIEQKTPYMIEWWTKAHELLNTCHITKEAVQKMVASSTAKLRDGCDWLFDECHRASIPLLIFSAGVGDVIEEIIHQQSTLYDNMHIVSNYMDFDKEGKMVGFKNDIIHIFNKNENVIHQSDYFENLKDRVNIILIGDSLGDLHMADGAEHMENKLKIGFLNTKVDESLELYKRKFDIVIVQDESLDLINAVIRKVVQSKGQ
ncbi:hypothetical protein CHS0354_037467 [Potamilus streckersoni]|uniref:5'-nucleotidase n=1 Tax=Potamilus streckersoni TaxID=2493646 RepID=A0AAE0RPD2_9BIVA|nr:hypothetical protein CHS0354_037467 [Potamilus streckersoni]